MLAAQANVPYALIWIDNPDVQPQGEEAEKTLPLREMASVIIANGGGVTLAELQAQMRAAMEAA